MQDHKVLAVIEQIDKLADHLTAKGVEIPDSCKRRDPKEPGRVQKESFELRLELIIMRLFRQQKKQLRRYFEATLTQKSAKAVFVTNEVLEVKEVEKLLIMLFAEMAMLEIDLFIESVGFAVDVAAYQVAALEVARDAVGKLIRGINETTLSAVQEAVASFADTPGMTIGDLIDLLPYGEVRAQMIAITETTNLFAALEQHYGQMLSEEWPGVRVVKQWFTNMDDRVCPICGANDGMVIDMYDVFPSGHDRPAAHPNCVIGETNVLAIGDIIAGTGRHYKGNVITIETFENKLTVTANHPILTLNGWVAAGLISEGDYILSYGSGKRVSSLVNINDQNRVTPIQDIFSSLDVNGFLVPISAPDFHNDGAGSDVAIIRPNSQIMNNIKSEFAHPLAKSDLVGRNVIFDITFPGFSPFTQFSERNLSTSSGSMSSFDLLVTLPCGHTFPLDGFSFGLGAGSDTSLVQSSSKSPAIDTRLFSQLVFGDPGLITAQQVVKIRNSDFLGHVYNLQTSSGLYVADGIITHNCRCWMSTRTMILESE